MKIKYITFILLGAILQSCTIIETTSPDGTVMKTTTISATGVAVGALEAAFAYNSIDDAK